MSDLERLDEALGSVSRGPNAEASVNALIGTSDHLVAIYNAARAYRDLLANGERVERERDEPLLGLATTRELLDELRARIEVDGKLDYRTVDGDKFDGERVEPDYEAAAKMMDDYLGFDTENFKIARRVVDAAIGKLLIDHPTEEE